MSEPTHGTIEQAFHTLCGAGEYDRMNSEGWGWAAGPHTPK
jgi:hypothetical protein